MFYLYKYYVPKENERKVKIIKAMLRENRSHSKILRHLYLDTLKGFIILEGYTPHLDTDHLICLKEI